MRDLSPSRRRIFGALALVMGSPRVYADEFDARTRPPAVSAYKWLMARPGVPRIGRADSDLTIVEFIDYRCAYCRAVQPALARLLVEYPRISLGLAEWPIYGDASTFAARLALIAARHGIFRQVHEALLTGRDATRREVLATAAAAGLSPDLAEVKEDPSWVDKQLAAIRADAATLTLTGTPSFLIGETVIRGALSYDDLHDLVSAESHALR